MAVAALALTGVASTPASSAPPTGVIRGAHSASAVPGSYLVKLKDNASVRTKGISARAHALSDGHRGKLGAVWTHAVHGFSATMSEAEAEKLAADPDVASVTQDQFMAGADFGAAPQHSGAAAPKSGTVITPNAVQTATTTWGLDRVDQRALPLDAKYHYDSALTGKNVHAYILSSGIRTTHEDFGGRASNGPDFVVEPTPPLVEACYGAGTADAGLVGGTEFGVAKDVKIVGIRVFDCQHIGEMAAITSGLDWVAANAVKPAVATLALEDLCIDRETGKTGDCDKDAIAVVVEAEENLIAQGVLLTMPAGDTNRGTCENDTGMAPDALFVGGTTISDGKLSVSNFGPCVDMWAPAEAIRTDAASSDFLDFASSGTPAAASYVAGAAALLLSTPQYANASPAQLTDLLVNKNSTKNAVKGLDADSPNKLLYTNPPGSFTIGSSIGLTVSSGGQASLFGVNGPGFMFFRAQAPSPAFAPVMGAATAFGTQSATSGWDSVSSAVNADGRVELFGVTRSHELWQRRQAAVNSSTWLPWSRLDTPGNLGMSNVSARLLTNNRLMLFGINEAGGASFRTQSAANSAAWGGWTSLGFSGQARSLSVEANSDGRLEVFIVDSTRKVWHAKQVSATDTNWSAFTLLDATTDMRMTAVARNDNGKLDAFAIDDLGGFWHRTQDTAGSTTYGSSWSSIPSNGALRSIAAGTSGHLIRLFAVDADGKVWQSTQTAVNAATYSAWTQIDGLLAP